MVPIKLYFSKSTKIISKISSKKTSTQHLLNERLKVTLESTSLLPPPPSHVAGPWARPPSDNGRRGLGEGSQPAFSRRLLQSPTALTEQLPTALTEQLPTVLTEKLPTATTAQLPTATTAQLPTATTVQLPTALTVQLPTALTAQLPAAPTALEPDLPRTSCAPHHSKKHLPPEAFVLSLTDTLSMVQLPQQPPTHVFGCVNFFEVSLCILCLSFTHACACMLLTNLLVCVIIGLFLSAK
ncbi:uncharacterized protein LOC119590434 [Penaeus monodon]|uniref:uncharacterized protein LOC119590434 n=1 Tax=Penaeus monodon TaxID=6687 RepID=UPI0018A7DF46|nr:uncharacterized protein LOC119590434 [Penaeus monodon]